MQSRDRERAIRPTYLLTFSCYGSHLPGQQNTVDGKHNVPGAPRLGDDPLRIRIAVNRMMQEPYRLDFVRRQAVLASIRETAAQRGWRLLAAHVRVSHVHVVVYSGCAPEFTMNSLKSYASRRLNGLGVDPPESKRWARHGSTVYLWAGADVVNAVDYVVFRQGRAMAVFWDESLLDSRGSADGRLAGNEAGNRAGGSARD